MITPNQLRARIFKAFCDENRLNILHLLKEDEMCACKILEILNIGQSTLSHHMRILCDSGVVNARREGKWTHYSLNREGAREVVDLLSEILQIK